MTEKPTRKAVRQLRADAVWFKAHADPERAADCTRRADEMEEILRRGKRSPGQGMAEQKLRESDDYARAGDWYTAFMLARHAAAYLMHNHPDNQALRDYPDPKRR